MLITTWRNELLCPWALVQPTLASSCAPTLQSIRSGCQKQNHTGAILNFPLCSETWGNVSCSSCLYPWALNLIKCSLRGQNLEQWITLFPAVDTSPWSNHLIYLVPFSLLAQTNDPWQCWMRKWPHEFLCLASFRSDLIARATPLALNLHSGLNCEA